jgi:hypothetical protein
VSGELRPGRVGLSPEEAQLQPLYARVIGLQYLNPGGVLCFCFFEGAIALAVLLALAELVTWWAVLILPATVAVMVKINDLVAGAVVRSAATVPEREQERFRREVTPVVGRASVPGPVAGADAPGEPTGAGSQRASSVSQPPDVIREVAGGGTTDVLPVVAPRVPCDTRVVSPPAPEAVSVGVTSDQMTPQASGPDEDVGERPDPHQMPPGLGAVPVAPAPQRIAPRPPAPDQVRRGASGGGKEKTGPENRRSEPALRDVVARREPGGAGTGRSAADGAHPLNAPAAEHLQRPVRQPTDRIDQADTPEQRSRQSGRRRYE